MSAPTASSALNGEINLPVNASEWTMRDCLWLLQLGHKAMWQAAKLDVSLKRQLEETRQPLNRLINAIEEKVNP